MEPTLGHDPEAVIQYLTERGITVQSIATTLGMDRNTLNKDRRTPKQVKKEELAKRIMAAFPQEFPGGEIPKGRDEEEFDIAKRYIVLLEKSLERVEAENAVLRRQVEAEASKR